MQKRFSSRVQLGIEIPWLQHSGGYLDGVIDGWHDLLGLPEGIRPQTPDNGLMYVYEKNGVQVFQLNERKSGLGDIQIAMGLDLGALGNFIQMLFHGSSETKIEQVRKTLLQSFGHNIAHLFGIETLVLQSHIAAILDR